MRRWRWSLLVPLVLVIALPACTNLGYYAHTARGHLKMITARDSVAGLIEDPATPADLKRQLELARDVRDYASAELGLPDNDSYREYVDTGRRFAVWSVFAAPELSLQAQTWCFPIAGCVPYRGYFSREAADKFAAGLLEEGLDVHVGGVTAYSTLGWFDDPLLNTMFSYGETRLAGLIFHELSHQQFYVQDDTSFNEAFATAVEETGVTKWLRDNRAAVDLDGYDAARERKEDFLALVASAQKRLKTVYDSEMADDVKRAEKARVIEDMRAEHRRIREQRWDGFGGYDRWFDAPINNAKLAAIAVYRDLVPAFTRLLQLCDGDYQRFYGLVERIGALDKDQRAEALDGQLECQ